MVILFYVVDVLRCSLLENPSVSTFFCVVVFYVSLATMRSYSDDAHNKKIRSKK
jgi:hypothetical protein